MSREIANLKLQIEKLEAERERCRDWGYTLKLEKKVEQLEADLLGQKAYSETLQRIIEQKDRERERELLNGLELI